MQIYERKRQWKLLLLIGGSLICIISVIYSHQFTQKLKIEEQKKMEIWSEANQLIASESDFGDCLQLLQQINSNNITIPVIIMDDKDSIVTYNNIKLPNKNQDVFLRQELNKMKEKNNVIPISLGDGDMMYLYYNDSSLITQLRWYSPVQLIVVFAFIFVAYLAFNFSRRSEQDQVWVGLARETAHQLGTPTSSLLGWVDVLEMEEVNENITKEIRFDINRLQTIIQRFSRIGAFPDLQSEDVVDVTQNIIEYLKNRTSKLVKYNIVTDKLEERKTQMCKPLFEWVIENICKNAIDAMQGEGSITVVLTNTNNEVNIDISDTGRGMSRKVQNSIFKPGFSTKLNGWGLGLTLAKRIVEQYHNGKLMILRSAPGKGTTFRLTIPLL